MTDLELILVLILALALGIAARVWAGRLDRQRIREYVEKGGGQVLDIAWNPFGPGWWGSHERIYDVRYKTRHGQARTSTCKTSMSAGVYWTGPEPPSGPIHSDEPSGMTQVLEVGNAPPEPIACLACGTRIPARETRCPKCGWSYRKS